MPYWSCIQHASYSNKRQSDSSLFQQENNLGSSIYRCAIRFTSDSCSLCRWCEQLLLMEAEYRAAPCSKSCSHTRPDHTWSTTDQSRTPIPTLLRFLCCVWSGSRAYFQLIHICARFVAQMCVCWSIHIQVQTDSYLDQRGN